MLCSQKKTIDRAVVKKKRRIKLKLLLSKNWLETKPKGTSTKKFMITFKEKVEKCN